MRIENRWKLGATMLVSGGLMLIGATITPEPKTPQLPTSDTSFEGIIVTGSNGAFSAPQEQYSFFRHQRHIITKATVDCGTRFVRIERMGAAGTDKQGHTLSQFHETSYDVTTGKYEGRTSTGYWAELSNGTPTIVTSGLFATDKVVPAEMLCHGTTPINPSDVPYARIMQMADLGAH